MKMERRFSSVHQTITFSRRMMLLGGGIAAVAGGSLDSIFGLASRDVRSLVAAAGTVAGQCYWTLIVLAVMSAATIAWRLAYLRVTVGARRYG